MKDFTLDLNQQKHFILKYIIEADSIIVFMADNSTKIFPYSREKELELLRLMEKQYRCIDIDSLERKRNANLILGMLLFINSGMQVYKMITENTNFTDYAMLIVLISGALGNALGYKDKMKLILDYDKMTYFFDNKSFFEEKFSLDINLIDDMSLTDLEKMLNSSSSKKLERKKDY